jgi:hypothetical protein
MGTILTLVEKQNYKIKQLLLLLCFVLIFAKEFRGDFSVGNFNCSMDVGAYLLSNPTVA